MRPIAALLRFTYRFVVGDDWRIAAGVVITLAVTALAAHADLPAWWIAPAGVVAALATTLRTRRGSPEPRERGDADTA